MSAEQGWHGTYNVAAIEPTCVQQIAVTIGGLIGAEPVFVRTGRPEPPPLIADLQRLSDCMIRAGSVRLSKAPDFDRPRKLFATTLKLWRESVYELVLIREACVNNWRFGLMMPRLVRSGPAPGP
jgi:hypothetical protein